MMTPTSTTPTFFDILDALFGRATTSAPRDGAAEAAEASAERRAFVDDMLCANPDAFASDMDVEMMLSHFPRSF